MAFPDAKVVATIRNPDTWFDSWWSSIGLTLEAMESQPIKWVLSLLENPDLKKIHGPARKIVPKGCSMSLEEAFEVTMPFSGKRISAEVIALNDLWCDTMKGLDGLEEYLAREKNLEQELIRRALFTDCYKVIHES